MKVAADEKYLLDEKGEGKLTPQIEGSIEMTQVNRNPMHMMRLRQGKSKDSQIKLKLRNFAEGKVVTIVMSLITLFALVGDDIRLWTTDKKSDTMFNSGLLISFIMFTTEILLNTVVIDEFKYSFFFWLDIIATLSVVIDIPWITDPLNFSLVNNTPSYLEANVVPGPYIMQSASSNQIQQVIKSLRLIRLIRIIKLYKYIVQSGGKDNEDVNPKKKKKKKQI